LLHASIMGGREFLYAVEVVLVTPIILQLGDGLLLLAEFLF